MAYFKPWTNWAIPIDMSPTYMVLTRERSQIPLITTLGFRSKRSSAELKGSSVLQHLHGYPQERGTDGANTQASPEETSCICPQSRGVLVTLPINPRGQYQWWLICRSQPLKNVLGKEHTEQNNQSQTEGKTESCFKCHSFLGVNYYRNRWFMQQNNQPLNKYAEVS